MIRCPRVRVYLQSGSLKVFTAMYEEVVDHAMLDYTVSSGDAQSSLLCDCTSLCWRHNSHAYLHWSWGYCQGMLDLGRQRPHWASAHDSGWHDAWFHAAETAEPAAAVAAAGQLLGMVAAGFEQLPGSFRVAADATIMACRAAECWEGEEAALHTGLFWCMSTC